VAQPEEVSYGTFHAGYFGVVPVAPDDDAAAVVFLRNSQRHPHMLNASWTIDFRYGSPFAGFDSPKVGIPASRVIA